MRSMFIVLCSLASIAAILAAVAPPAERKCSQEGKDYRPGDKIVGSDTWYNCTASGKVRAAGCVYKGKNLLDDEMVEDGDVLLQCQINGGKAELPAYACIQHSSGQSIHRRLGCHFVDGTGTNQFEYECQYDAAGKTAKKVPVACNYVVSGGVYVIAPGCSRDVGQNKIVACVQSGNDLTYKEYSSKEAASSGGAKAC